jgi:poly-gamma-glutamate capsule biosynthesis protein CapA/YwtB (metallophosphatase superfamily)/DNA-binding beta-propeller fold protein YncE
MQKSFFYLSIFLFLSLIFCAFVFVKTNEVNQEIENLFTASLVFPLKRNEKITLFFVGDVMLDREVKKAIEKYGEGDFKFSFLKISPLLKEADILVGNLEGPVSDKGKKVGSIYSFRMDPKAIEGLKFAGFDILSLANNHIFDYGREALEDTFLRLQDAGIDYLGGGFNEIEACSPKIKEIKGTKIAFLAFTNLGSPFWQAKSATSGICWLDKENLEKGIKGAKNKADLVIVLFHFGNEYEKKPNIEQKDFAHFAIDSGADLVVGDHPHVIQEIEEYKGKYITYSLGNFVFDQAFSKETMEGLVLKVIVEEKKIKEVSQIKFEINQYFQPEISDKEKEKSQTQKEEKPAFNVKPILTHLPGQIVKCVYRISGIPSPKGAAFSPDGKEIWVTSLMNTNRGVLVFDAKTGAHIKDIVLPDGGGVEIIFNLSGNKAYVSQMETARVFEIDAKTKEILRIFDTKSSWTKVLAISPKEDFLFASNWSGNNVSIIDLKTGKLIENIPTVKTPRGIYILKDGKTLYVAGFENGEIEKINLETKERKIILKTEGAMRHIVGDEEKGVLYFSDMGKNKIFKVNLQNDKVEEFAKTDNNPNTIALTPDKKVLIVSNRGENHPSGNYNIPGPEWGSILFFDTSTGKMLDALVAGNQPTALAVSPDGKYFVYSDFLDGNLTLCQLPSYEEFVAGGGGRSSIYRKELQK